MASKPSPGDPYRVLGIDRDASEDDIKGARRRRAAECQRRLYENPNDQSAEEEFKAINVAADTLLNRGLRSTYDARLDVAFDVDTLTFGSSPPGVTKRATVIATFGSDIDPASADFDIGPDPPFDFEWHGEGNFEVIARTKGLAAGHYEGWFELSIPDGEKARVLLSLDVVAARRPAGMNDRPSRGQSPQKFALDPQTVNFGTAVVKRLPIGSSRSVVILNRDHLSGVSVRVVRMGHQGRGVVTVKPRSGPRFWRLIKQARGRQSHGEICSLQFEAVALPDLGAGQHRSTATIDVDGVERTLRFRLSIELVAPSRAAGTRVSSGTAATPMPTRTTEALNRVGLGAGLVLAEAVLVAAVKSLNDHPSNDVGRNLLQLILAIAIIPGFVGGIYGVVTATIGLIELIRAYADPRRAPSSSLWWLIGGFALVAAAVLLVTATGGSDAAHDSSHGDGPSATTSSTVTTTTIAPTTTAPRQTEPQPAVLPADRPPVIATDFFTHDYVDPENGMNRVEVYAIRRGDGTLSIDFGAAGLSDLAPPDGSCLIGKGNASYQAVPSSVDLALAEPGLYMGTITFSHRYLTGWEFFYGCSFGYRGIDTDGL